MYNTTLTQHVHLRSNENESTMSLIFYSTELSFVSSWLFCIVFLFSKILGEPGNVNMDGKAGYWSCQGKCLRYVVRLKSNIGYLYSTGASFVKLVRRRNFRTALRLYASIISLLLHVWKIHCLQIVYCYCGWLPIS